MNLMPDVNTTLGSRGKERQKQLDQSKHTRASTQTSEAKCAVRNRKHQKSKRYQHQDQKLQQHRDREDSRRVHDLTEGIRSEFLPSAFNVILPQCEDPKAELTPDRCRIVAGAALCVAALMNAPPWFFDFLLRVPWKELKHMGQGCMDGQSDSDIERLNKTMDVCDEERSLLVNTPIDPSLMYTVLEFIYQDEYQESVPPMLRPLSASGQNGQDNSQVKSSTINLESIAALLDGATPLHCASIRGNPAQVNHLMQNGADPTIKTFCGDLPIHLVPVCGDKNPQTGQRSCRCMRMKEQEMWECRSGLARNLIFKKCLLNIRMGVVAWFHLILMCILNWFAMWGYSTCLCSRPTVQKHASERQDQKRRDARRRAQSLLDRMRQESRQGHTFLGKARQDARELPQPGDHGGTISGFCEFALAEDTFRCFVRAVHALQSLDLQGDTVPQGFMDSLTPPLETSDCHVMEDEQADLYCCWAESVLLKFRGCRCAGCAALAVQAIRMAHIQVARLITRVDKKQEQQPTRWRAVGESLMRVVHVHICLLLDTEAKQSATRASVWRAEHCLKEWERLRERGLQVNVLLVDEHQAVVLDNWAKTANSNLVLAEALHGVGLLPSQTLTEILESSILYSPTKQAYLARPINEATISSLELALKSATSSSPSLFKLTREIADRAKQEIKVAEELKKAMCVKGASVFYGAVERLSEAIEAARVFPHLLADVENARTLRKQWVNRTEAIERLEATMSQARQPIRKGKKSIKGTRELNECDLEMLGSNIKLLESAIDEAKESNIGVDKARKLLKELQAQSAAVEAASQLDTIMAKKPCGSGVLRGALAKAEIACTSANGNSGIGSPAEFLLPRVQHARKRLEVEKAVEALHRATTSCKSVADLAKLEAMILAARSVGAEDLDPGVYQTASEQRSRLHNASLIRQSLESAVKSLRKQHKQEDAEALQKALEGAKQCWDLVEDEASKAKEALEQWKSLAENEARLMKVLQGGSTADELSRAISEAASAGVKVQAARRTLRLMQNLEGAMAKAAESPFQYSHLKKHVDAAESGGVNHGLVSLAQEQLRRILLLEATGALEQVLKQKGSLDISERCRAYKSALKQASQVLDIDFEHHEDTNQCETCALSNSTLKQKAADPSEEAITLIALAKTVHQHLHKDEAELQKLEAQREEQERLERLRLEQVRIEKQRLENERLEKERLQKQEREKQESVRKEKEKAERERKQREKHQKERELAMQLVQDKQRRDRPRQDRFRRRGFTPVRTLSSPGTQPYNHESGYSQMDPLAGEYDWENSISNHGDLGSPETDLSKLMDLSKEESGLLNGRAELFSSGTLDLNLLDASRSGLGGVPGNDVSLQEPVPGIDQIGLLQPNWSMNSTPNLGMMSSDFSIGTTREQVHSDNPIDSWELDGLRDIQTGHNAPYYGMHVDLINSLAPRNSGVWTPQTLGLGSIPDMSEPVRGLGILDDESGDARLQPMPLSSGQEYHLGDAGRSGIGSQSGQTLPPPLSFKLNSLWGLDAELQNLRSQPFSSSTDGRFDPYYSSGFGQNLSGYELFGAVEGSNQMAPPMQGPTRVSSFGQCSNNSQPSPFMTPSDPQPSSNLVPIIPSATSLGFPPPQPCQSPFPGVGVGIPGSADYSLPRAGPRLRSSSMSLLDNDSRIYSEDSVDETSLAMFLALHGSSRSHAS